MLRLPFTRLLTDFFLNSCLSSLSVSLDFYRSWNNSRYIYLIWESFLCNSSLEHTYCCFSSSNSNFVPAVYHSPRIIISFVIGGSVSVYFLIVYFVFPFFGGIPLAPSLLSRSCFFFLTGWVVETFCICEFRELQRVVLIFAFCLI